MAVVAGAHGVDEVTAQADEVAIFAFEINRTGAISKPRATRSWSVPRDSESCASALSSAATEASAAKRQHRCPEIAGSRVARSTPPGP